MGSVRGRRVLLTGASSGIGHQAAILLAERHAHLALVARRGDRLRELAADIAGRGLPAPLTIPADLGEPGMAGEVAAQAEERLGGIDVLVNNAGASLQGLSWVVGDRDEARGVFETNFWSPLALTAAIAPGMVARGDGVIVNTGSMVQVAPFPHLGHYCASRSALALITQIAGMELGPKGVRVVEVAFGAIDTPGSTENRLLEGGGRFLDGPPGLGKLKSAAATLVRAVEGPSAGVVFYPRMLRWVHALPGLGRRHARRAARATDFDDMTVRVGGSAGSADIREARERWEREHANASD
jgi:short-subunit dehydrogenase